MVVGEWVNFVGLKGTSGRQGTLEAFVKDLLSMEELHAARSMSLMSCERRVSLKSPADTRHTGDIRAFPEQGYP